MKKDFAEMGKALKEELRERVTAARQELIGDSRGLMKAHAAHSVGIIGGVAFRTKGVEPSERPASS